MAKGEPFEEYALQYEDWFEGNRFVYESEIRAVREQLPESGDGIEIGVGSGQFAAPLGIKLGIEPSRKMRQLAQSRGIETIEGVAERLPFRDSQFEESKMVSSPSLHGRFRKAGFRLTLPRQAILNVFSQNPQRLSAEDVFLSVHEKYLGIGLATVYRTLDLLIQMRLIFKFDFKISSHQIHFYGLCERCK